MYYVNEGLNALIRWIGTLYFHVFHALILKRRVGTAGRGAEEEVPSGFWKPEHGSCVVKVRAKWGRKERWSPSKARGCVLMRQYH